MKTLYFQELERLESERSRIWHEIGHAPACPPWAAGQEGECAGEYPRESERSLVVLEIQELTSSPPSRFARRESGKEGDSFLPSPRSDTGMDSPA